MEIEILYNLYSKIKNSILKDISNETCFIFSGRITVLRISINGVFFIDNYSKYKNEFIINIFQIEQISKTVFSVDFPDLIFCHFHPSVIDDLSIKDSIFLKKMNIPMIIITINELNQLRFTYFDLFFNKAQLFIVDENNNFP